MPKKTVPGSSIIQIRQDEAAGLVRAFFAARDGSGAMEVATISLGLCHACPGVFDRWKKMLQYALTEALREATGEEVASFHEEKLCERN